MLSARAAAAQVGMTKAGIIRSIHTGKLSATRNANREFEIDPVELFRVYAPLSTNGNSHAEIDEHLTPAQSERVSTLERALRDKEDVIRAKDQVITAQAFALEVMTQENTRMAAVMTQYAPPKSKAGWWARLLGG